MAALFAAFASALVALTVAIAMVVAITGPGALRGIGLVCGVGLVFVLAHALVLGIPAAWWLTRRSAFRPLPMAVAGVVVGVLPSAVLFLADALAESGGVLRYLRLLAVEGVAGAAGGITFLWVYRLIDVGGRRRDNDAQPRF